MDVGLVLNYVNFYVYFSLFAFIYCSPSWLYTWTPYNCNGKAECLHNLIQAQHNWVRTSSMRAQHRHRLAVCKSSEGPNQLSNPAQMQTKCDVNTCHYNLWVGRIYIIWAVLMSSRKDIKKLYRTSYIYSHWIPHISVEPSYLTCELTKNYNPIRNWVVWIFGFQNERGDGRVTWFFVY